MTLGCLEWLRQYRFGETRGLVVTAEESTISLGGIEQRTGDHPEPGDRSLAAARRLEELTAQVLADDRVYALISGGASSLIGAPLEGMSDAEYRERMRQLLESGMDIVSMNRVRRGISRWAAGRLAMAVAPAPVQPVLISDVSSNDPAIIGSGPCTADDAASTPHVAPPLIASHDSALAGGVARARTLGLDVRMDVPLAGEAAVRGRALARTLVALHETSSAHVLLVAGGETTVTLPPTHGEGGRCQELALACAAALSGADTAITLLVAGTDGRDGPTDAAGAVIDEGTWDAIRSAGRDPDRDLRTHDAYPALDSTHALLRTGHTGTNMMDLAFALVRAN